MMSRSRWILAATVGICLAGAAANPATQVRYATGQNIVPVFEGWEKNADGSFNFVFGYMNRNYDEELDIPVGPNNMLEPGDVDRGQPTHFFNRRQQFMFKVRVPSDWGAKKDLVWTLTTRGKTEKAYASMIPFWEIGVDVYQQNRGGPEDDEDKGPTIQLVGEAKRTISLADSLRVDVKVADDGRPLPRAGRGGFPEGGRGAGRGDAGRSDPAASVMPRAESPLTQMVVKNDPGVRLGVTWVVHRRSGSGSVTFDPQKPAVTNGSASTTMRFSERGTYVLRGYADDGILLDYADITVTVN